MADTLELVPDDGTATSPDRGAEHVRIAIVGSGFSGIGMAIRLKEAGIEDFVVLERADDVGGTWEANTYPGCQCDVPSHLYSFSFEPNPSWTRTYSRQPEIWAYLRRCTERYDLQGHLRFGHELTGATWDEAQGRWLVETTGGDFSVALLIDATGPLSHPAVPAIRGLRRFEGKLFHSAEWDHDHDLTGERVAVIGTGASAIQFVPRIQKQVGQMHVFQRTAPWIMPHTDRPTSSFERRLYRRIPLAQRLVRTAVYWTRESYLVGFAKNPRMMRPAERIARLHLRRQVRDHKLRRKLEPDFRLGCKRVLLSNEWYPALTRPNVELVTDAISHIDGNRIVLADGSSREVDTIILGTGFHVTDNPVAERLVARDGRTLAAHWKATGAQAYLGSTVPSFPNLFMLAGPNTGIGHTSLVYMIEAQIDYLMHALEHLEQTGAAAVDVLPSAQAAWNAEIDRAMEGSVWTAGGCASWYLDANGRNSTLWPGFTLAFARAAADFRAEDHRTLEAPVATPA